MKMMKSTTGEKRIKKDKDKDWKQNKGKRSLRKDKLRSGPKKNLLQKKLNLRILMETLLL